MLKIILIVAPFDVRGEESKGDEPVLDMVRMWRALYCQSGLEGCRVFFEPVIGPVNMIRVSLWQSVQYEAISLSQADSQLPSSSSFSHTPASEPCPVASVSKPPDLAPAFSFQSTRPSAMELGVNLSVSQDGSQGDSSRWLIALGVLLVDLPARADLLRLIDPPSKTKIR